MSSNCSPSRLDAYHVQPQQNIFALLLIPCDTSHTKAENATCGLEIADPYSYEHVAIKIQQLTSNNTLCFLVTSLRNRNSIQVGCQITNRIHHK